jgi:hypothetical protein
MTKYKLLCGASLSVLLLIGSLLSFRIRSSQAASTVEGAAHDALPNILKHIGNDYQNYGFNDQHEVDTATLTSPYEILALLPEAVHQYHSGQRIANIARQEQWWEFPVVVNGEPRGLLSVVQMNGQWQGVSFGALPLSRQVVRLQKQPNMSRVAIKFVRVPQIHATFALIEQGNQERLIHLASHPRLLQGIDKENLTAYSPEEIMPQIDQALREVSQGDQANRAR